MLSGVFASKNWIGGEGDEGWGGAYSFFTVTVDFVLHEIHLCATDAAIVWLTELLSKMHFTLSLNAYICTPNPRCSRSGIFHRPSVSKYKAAHAIMYKNHHSNN